MRQILLCLGVALVTSGCVISTELDPGGSPKYRGTKATGTNFAAGSRFDAKSAPVTKTLGDDDIQRLFRPGGNTTPKGTN